MTHSANTNASSEPVWGPYTVPQLRMDTWNELQSRSAMLKEFALSNHDITEPSDAVARCLETLTQFEAYWAYPGPERIARLSDTYARRDYPDLAIESRELARQLVGDTYRLREPVDPLSFSRVQNAANKGELPERDGKPYFEVLVVDGIDAYDHDEIKQGLRACRRETDEFVYEIVNVPSVEDAIIATQFNWTIQAVFLRYNCPFKTASRHPALRRYLDVLERDPMPVTFGLDRSVELARVIHKLRPELDLFLVTDAPLDRVAGNIGADFRRVFYRLEQYMEQHLSVLKWVRARYDTPFFDALRRFSEKPTGVFHALPIARGKSMSSGHWARDLLEFYGPNIFMAETSATSGGLDSLNQPKGPIKKAQDLAARAFGARSTYFVTNGTSTANKIVAQALLKPGDIVLVDRDCHKSHHYALVLAGALPVYLDSYALPQYSMYGAVPIEEIERQLLELKEAGKLDRVKMLILTNCTFDGVTYDPELVMRRVLAIKPDMVFLWDEAWFGYGRCSPTLRRRTAMGAAETLREQLRAGTAPEELNTDLTRIRVYATHSTHKTLTSLRQGSMIHVHDEDFEQRVADAFNEAFMTHTSTSPNYQIIASLDAGRRQVELEGFEMVEQTIGLAMTLRQRINENPQLSRFFSVLRPRDMIPAKHRGSGIEFYYDTEHGWGPLQEAYNVDEFTLDPTRVTLYIGATGMDGDTFRHLLMDKYDIQINKTSRNTVLFMLNIGTTRGDVAYLIDTLVQISDELADRLSLESSNALTRHTSRVDSLTNGPPLPNFSAFHDAFKPDDTQTREGDLRRAYFLAYDHENTDLLPLDRDLLRDIELGKEFVSAAFITPYPPGFPVLVPGQVISREIIAYLLELDVKEIHGYDPSKGLRVFTQQALQSAAQTRATESLERT